MLEFQEKKKLRRFIYSPLFLFVIALAIMTVGRGTWGVYQKSQESEDKLAASLIELQRLEEREKKLITDIAELETDRGIEAEIREKYRVAKEGEEMIILLGEKGEEEKPVEEKRRWWQKIFR